MNIKKRIQDAGMPGPRFHGNGFTQLYLSENTRLHVWHKSLAPVRDHNATIHNHRYDVFSTVFAGKLWHRTYEVQTDAHPDRHDVRIIQLGSASNGVKDEVKKASPDVETGITGKLWERHSYALAAGSEYTMRRPFFHSSDPVGDDPVVTVFTRHNKGDEWAQVLCGIYDERATHAFDPATQPTEDQMWDAIVEGVASIPLSLSAQFGQVVGALLNG